MLGFGEHPGKHGIFFPLNIHSGPPAIALFGPELLRKR
jgi:hypothetical protein